MMNNTPTGAKKHGKSTEPESQPKHFSFLLLFSSGGASSKLHDSFTMVFTQNSSMLHSPAHHNFEV